MSTRSMTRLWRSSIGLWAMAACASLNTSAPADAQQSRECSDAQAALAQANRDFNEWDVLPECGITGANALGQALRSAMGETDPHYLQALVAVSGSVQAEPVLEGAAALARDAGATRMARVAAMVTLLRQFDAALYFPIGISWQQLLEEPLPACSVRFVTDSEFEVQYTMASDYVERIRTVMTEVSGDGDPVLSAMASCLAQEIR